MRFLVVNADDFGFTRDVNQGIVDTYRNGILTATTLMANGLAFDHAVDLARENPDLDVGCHLALVGGDSVLEPRRRLPTTVSRMIAAIATGRLRVVEELRAQIQRIFSSGLQPSHLDTHKHTHLFPPVLDAVAELSVEFGIKWVRRPFDLAGSSGGAPAVVRATSKSLSFLQTRFQAVLNRHGCLSTDHFAGFQLTGRFRSKELVELVERLPPGMTEFMCHPGYCGDELRAARTRLKESRVLELEALTSPDVQKAIERCSVKLRNFRDTGSVA
jgi:predicted glycoside hydrolase/deacetylase ChbG (UPF0249 family)